MFEFILNSIKIIFLLGFLILIHEGGHFIIAKLCKIKVNEFAIGFGPVIFEKKGKETIYRLRLIPVGGFVNLEGEEEESDFKGSFSKASVPKKIAIISAGGLVNIFLGIILYFILVLGIVDFKLALENTIDLILNIFDNIKNIFAFGIQQEQLMGIVGISDVITKTNSAQNYFYMLSLISISLGITNLLPILPLDGGKIVLIIFEAIRGKKINKRTNEIIQSIGFYFIIGLSIFVMYNDIVKILN